ncbi:MAG: hypothetical protein ABSH21_12510 [Verrucomicrobiia bacterium]|jgi:hypothetical protein
MTHWFHAAKIYPKTIGERLEPVKPLVATTNLQFFGLSPRLWPIATFPMGGLSVTQPSTPADTLSVGDPGDDTGRRFDYQHAWAAIVGCGLLEEPPEFAEILEGNFAHKLT